MSQYESFSTQCKNIGRALVMLGVAIGIKLFTGNAVSSQPMFFSERLRKAGKIENEVNQLDKAAAADAMVCPNP